MSMFRWAATAVFSCLFAGALWAAALSVPKGPVLLTVGGDIAAQNAGEVAEFDREMLQNLDWREVTSYTYYTEGEHIFAGPTLASLMERLGVDSGTLQATALDDYSISIPVEDIAESNIILAMEQNGQPMRIRDRGPIWIIYPHDAPDNFNENQIARSIWQLKSIIVTR